MSTGVPQEMLNILHGMVDQLPEPKVSLGIAIGLAILTIFTKRLGIFLTFLILTVLAAYSFFAPGDVYHMSAERVIAGTVLGFFAVVVNLYLFVRTIADWMD